MEKLLNAVFWISDAFSRTHDPILAEYRFLQRHFILSFASTVFAMVFEVLISSMMPAAVNASRPLIQAVIEPLSWFPIAAMIASMVWMAGATYALWRFERHHS